MTHDPAGALAIFDLDNTLLGGDSDLLWGNFLADEGYVDADQYRRTNEQFYREYAAGRLDIRAFLAFALRPLKEIPPQTLLDLRERFTQERIEPLILPKGETLISEHRQKGHQLLIMTATNRFITEPIARRLGIANLLATEPERRDGRYTGEVCGTPCFQEGKVRRLEQWLGRDGLAGRTMWFYSDSHNDIPLLERADHPVAVDPDPQLRDHAVKHGWKQISLR